MSAFSAHKIAGLLDISVRRLQQLAAEGVVPRTVRGDYPLVACQQGYVRFLRSTHGEMPDGDLAAHKARLIKFRADIAELEAGRLAGELVPVAQVGQVWSDAALRMRSRLLNIPFKTGPLLATEDSPQACSQIVENEIIQALEELSNTEIEVYDEAATPAEDDLEPENLDDVGSPPAK